MKKLGLKSLIVFVLSLPYALTNNLSAKADYIHQTLAEYSGTIMEFRIEKQRITLVLEIDKKDKKVFSDLLEKNNNPN